MPLKSSKGNMYSFVDYTWNPIKGACMHDCSYCYMKRFKLPDLHLDEKELKTDLGSGHFIFIGSGTDIFADNVPGEWIQSVIDYCKKFDNKYLFQTKNPWRLFNFELPPDVVWGTTIETNRFYPEIMRDAPPPVDRGYWMSIPLHTRMVTIEPILDFDLDAPADMESLPSLIRKINPAWVNIGADSKGHSLPEPSKEKIIELVKTLQKANIRVIKKKNLSRLMGEV